MRLTKALYAGAFALALLSTASAQSLTIATVNNGDMIRMQKLTSDFTKANPGIKLNWVTLEENVLRQKVTTDIATKAGQYDIITIGTYEVPIWAKKGWLVPLDNLGADYDVNDLLPAIRSGLSYNNKLYAAPFYGESSMVMYRTDLMKKAGLTMPKSPTWAFIAKAAAKMNDPKNGVYGICLRGKAGWGENMAFLTTLANSYGARWFNMKWKPLFDGPEWKNAINYYVNLMKADGPPGASANGFNANLTLFNAGKCGMWIDATVAAGFVTDPKKSKVADKVGFALAPNAGLGKNANWLWSWALGIPAASKHVAAAEKFIAWATSKHYTELVASKEGWARVPPGTRTSLYKNPAYLKAAPFAQMTLDSIDSADPSMNGTVKKKPYIGVQFAAIPEFEGLGDTVGQYFSGALAGKMTVDAALKQAQDYTTRVMTKAGYIK